MLVDVRLAFGTQFADDFWFRPGGADGAGFLPAETPVESGESQGGSYGSSQEPCQGSPFTPAIDDHGTASGMEHPRGLSERGALLLRREMMDGVERGNSLEDTIPER
jgi:hypothetical protein